MGRPYDSCSDLRIALPRRLAYRLRIARLAFAKACCELGTLQLPPFGAADSDHDVRPCSPGFLISESSSVRDTARRWPSRDIALQRLGLLSMSDLNKDAPRRYIVDGAGQRVLVGLTVEETIEFERLDSPAACRLTNGQVLWDGRDVIPTWADQRWLEFYAKHERAWRDWMDGSRLRPDRKPHILN